MKKRNFLQICLLCALPFGFVYAANMDVKQQNVSTKKENANKIRAYFKGVSLEGKNTTPKDSHLSVAYNLGVIEKTKEIISDYEKSNKKIFKPDLNKYNIGASASLKIEGGKRYIKIMWSVGCTTFDPKGSANQIGAMKTLDSQQSMEIVNLTKFNRKN